MRAYSFDLRQKVVAAYERGESTIDEIAGLFSVGPTFVKKMLRLHRDGGDLSPLPHGGGHTPKLSDKHLQLIRSEIAQNNDVTIEELRDLLRTRSKVEVSQPTVSRVLARLDLPRKKTVVASERNNYKRAWFRRRVSGIDPIQLIFIDEAAVNTAMTRRYGRAAPGERVVESGPRNYGEQTSIISAIGLRGLVATMSLEGAVDTLAFNTYINEVLAAKLNKGDVVVLDNLNVRKASQIEEVAAGRGARVIWLAPYSPDYSPIEQCWSKIKQLLRAAKARTREELEAALVRAIDLITSSDIRGWFNHCGYLVAPD